VVPLTYRKTVATFLDHGGLSAVADQLGHARISMTQDVCMGRQVVHSSAALTLEQLAADR
jgi:integrase